VSFDVSSYSTFSILIILTVNSFPLLCLLFATISIMTTSSRMTYAFAR
jgi:hypothetical protein